jgi:UDP-N-acetyl-D-mannosaminuronate dehydrogenase
MNIGILGQGEIGTANKEFYERQQQQQVFTYDPKYNDTFTLPDCDVYLLCPSSDRVLDAARLLQDRKGLIIIESTIKVGTTRQVAEMLGRDVIHCPQRYWKDDPEKRGVQRDRVIGATTGEVLLLGAEFYSQMNMSVIPIWPVEVAEITKYAENAYRALQIAFAEELLMYCKRHDVSFYNVRNAIMTADNMHYLPEARQGIGKDCLPLAMSWMSGLRTINAALDADRRYKEYIKQWQRYNH